MAELPVEPMLARSLLVSGEMGCSVEMIVIASCLSVKRSQRTRQRPHCLVAGWPRAPCALPSFMPLPWLSLGWLSRSVWVSGRGKELQEAKARFAVAEGDLVTYINVVKAWEMHKRNRKWLAAAPPLLWSRIAL